MERDRTPAQVPGTGGTVGLGRSEKKAKKAVTEASRQKRADQLRARAKAYAPFGAGRETGHQEPAVAAKIEVENARRRGRVAPKPCGGTEEEEEEDGSSGRGGRSSRLVAVECAACGVALLAPVRRRSPVRNCI